MLWTKLNLILNDLVSKTQKFSVQIRSHALKQFLSELLDRWLFTFLLPRPPYCPLFQAPLDIT